MQYIHPLSAEVQETSEVLGAKAHGLIMLRRLGLPVPAGFVISTEVCRAFLRDGCFPEGFAAELTVAIGDLETATQRRLGGPERPLTVSVRSGAAVSMPGMMDTVLNLGLTATAARGLTTETGEPRFASIARLRFLSSFASAITDTGAASAESMVVEAIQQNLGDEQTRIHHAIEVIEALISEQAGQQVLHDAFRQLELAITAVCSSWDTPRARTFRAIHDIPHDLGTAVIVQAMVFGHRDRHSGTGVAFSRDPNTGERVPFGDILFGSQGDDVVSGRSPTLPLCELADREPAVWAQLVAALDRIEAHYRDSCCIEFTFEGGEFWVLQVHRAKVTAAAAVHIAVALVEEGVIGHQEALQRITPLQLQHARTPRMILDSVADILARGQGACPGVAVGRVVTTPDTAVRMATHGPVILVRPDTSPLDMHGLAAAAGVLTAHGGPTCHAAVVARAMGKPAVVGVAELTIDATTIRIGRHVIPEGTLIAIDGTGGEITAGNPPVGTTTAPHVHRLLEWADQISGDNTKRSDAERLSAAHTALRRP
ncbi:pyruvate, phosphate dikinase [Nocardia donostiensis]|uniref:Pyruvate, phosphate dikinase n=1 Tax=Nocardia donostiensis TaxID=1538463 RepID=A0A1W0B7D2_9NOCA|nr:pyruvate, phosphate dikinase [Nocardia donostiensis]ONM46240.1 pyruvate, phosphate dikinase [Nocardia donostiensis]OQS13335.1 pyruvate, phosphate dikinase [Nocardia donostiensis]OQS18435.1 pyruvate, phosphate dikinase [Nocardia donostiensis]